MTVVRAPVEALAEGEITLDRDTARYLVRVRRLREGDTFVAFDPRAAREAAATIVRVSEREVVVRVEPLSAAAVVAPRRVTLVQGIPKGTKADAIVRDATELGATDIVLAACARSVVRLEGREEARVARWEKIAREAARQSGRADVPRVTTSSWEEALAAVPEGSTRLCFWENATVPAGTVLRAAIDDAAPIAFAVGPEGGLEPREVEHAERAGFHVVSLGKLVLRTETVAAAVLGAVRALDVG